MSIDNTIKEAKRDLRYHEDTFVQEIVNEYYDDAMEEVLDDEEEAPGYAIDAFLKDMARGRASNIWTTAHGLSHMKPEELLKDPRVLEYSFENLERDVGSIKEALVEVVAELLFDALVWDSSYQSLEKAVREAVASRR